MRLIGAKIREACEILEQSGPLSGAAMSRHMAVVPQNAGKYCSRAVGLGLMTVERWEERNTRFAEYSIVEGWRDIADKRKTTQATQTLPQKATRWAGVNSVFGMAA